MSFKMEFNVGDFEQSFKSYPKNLVKHLTRASKTSAFKVEDQARQNHRFTTRTGRLVKSIIGLGTAFEVKLTLENEGANFGTEYGKYVHGGHGSWGADRFIFKAMESNEKHILDRWQKAIDRANKEF